jgi:hypothetical protein
VPLKVSLKCFSMFSILSTVKEFGTPSNTSTNWSLVREPDPGTPPVKARKICSKSLFLIPNLSNTF